MMGEPQLPQKTKLEGVLDRSLSIWQNIAVRISREIRGNILGEGAGELQRSQHVGGISTMDDHQG